MGDQPVDGVSEHGWLTLRERFTAPGAKRVLALDGGGIRGALTIGFLRRIEAILRDRHGQPHLVLADYFDLIAGTSTGAIIASLLATGLSVDDVGQMYFELGQETFTRQRGMSGLLAARYRSAPLERALRAGLGERTFGSDHPDVRTGLCVVVKRADTQSTWPLFNHPDGAFFEHNRHIHLWQAVRASTAAPTYFQPEAIRVRNELGAFVDGGVSMANNPALLAFQVATLSGFPFRWPIGEHNLLLVSVGTGNWSRRMPIKQVVDARRWNWATQIPAMLLQDAADQVELLLQWMGHSPTSRIIDRERGDLKGDNLGPSPAMTYLRYNAALESDALSELGLDHLAPRAVSLRNMADPANSRDLETIGRHAADRDVDPSHLSPSFDLVR